MSKTIYVDDLPRVDVLDVVRRVGGKRKLRTWDSVPVTLEVGSTSIHHVVKLDHRPCWRGGRRTYLVCPRCKDSVFILLMDPVTSELRCRTDWSGLRYRSQERGQRRGDLISSVMEN